MIFEQATADDDLILILLNQHINAYKIILLQEEMSSLKFMMAKARNQNISTKCSPIAFRTILKCRNNSLEPIPPINQSLQRSSSVSRISNYFRATFLDQTASKQFIRKDKAINSKIQEISSKLYVKEMQTSKVVTPRSISTSRSQTNNSKVEKNTIAPRQVQNLEELQKRIDMLLKEKIQKYKKHKKGVGLINWGYLCKQAIQLQLQETLKQLRADKPSDQSLFELSARIELIEKMIASQYIQDQLFKQRYHGSTSQRSNLASFHKIHSYVSKDFNQNFQTNIQSSRKNKLQAVGNFTTTNQQAFSKPSKENYINQRYKYPMYSPNRQVLPRSSYSKDFLKYGVMPTFDCKKMGMESLPVHSSFSVKTSSYQVEFKQRSNNCKPVDYRDMDCYRDKFKNPNISFMNHCKRLMLDASNSLKKTSSNKVHQIITASDFNKLLSQTSFKDFYKTQHKRNYQEYTETSKQTFQWVRGAPKQRRIKQLKSILRQPYLRV